MNYLLAHFQNDSTSLAIEIIVSATLGFLAWAARPGARKTGGISVLEYGSAMKVFVLLVLVVEVVLVTASFRAPDREREGFLRVALLFGALITPLALETFRVRITFDDEFIRCYSPWRPNRKIRWDEIISLQFSASMQWWVVTTRHQGSIRLQKFISGKEDFFQELQERGLIQPGSWQSGAGH